MRVLNFGSLNCDHIYSLPHIATTGETVLSSTYMVNCGGKGFNQSVALKNAGVEVYHAGTIGKGDTMLLDKLREYGCDTKYIGFSDTPTGHAIIQLGENGDNCIVLYGGANMCQTVEFIDSVLSDFKSGDMLVVQNEINNVPYIIDTAFERGMTIVLNPSPCNKSLREFNLNKVSMLFINEVEGYQLTGEIKSEKITKKIIGDYPHIKVILTLGGDGAIYANNEQYIHQPAFPAVVKDTTAAGDTFMGYFLAGIIQALPPAQALELAAKAAAVTVSRVGAADIIPHYEEVVYNSICQD